MDAVTTRRPGSPVHSEGRSDVLSPLTREEKYARKIYEAYLSSNARPAGRGDAAGNEGHSIGMQQAASQHGRSHDSGQLSATVHFVCKSLWDTDSRSFRQHSDGWYKSKPGVQWQVRVTPTHSSGHLDALYPGGSEAHAKISNAAESIQKSISQAIAKEYYYCFDIDDPDPTKTANYRLISQARDHTERIKESIDISPFSNVTYDGDTYKSAFEGHSER